MRKFDPKGCHRPVQGVAEQAAGLDGSVADAEVGWGQIESAAAHADVWDAFELDEETAAPQPEYGDFWTESDEGEPC